MREVIIGGCGWIEHDDGEVTSTLQPGSLVSRLAV